MSFNKITTCPFSPGALASVVAQHCGNDGAASLPQVDYLGRYCADLKAKTLVVESQYICRHFVDEFAYYYSRNLRPPKTNSVARIHVFSSEVSQEQLREQMVAPLRGATSARVLQDAYLGFISVRPVPEAPIGRTVLKRYGDEPLERQITAITTYEAHLASLRLQASGLAFQQQDAAAGACATAALWTAVSRVARIEHIRAPTPAEVSLAGMRQGLGNGTPLPAGGGLTMEQLANAVRELGFCDEQMRADRKPELFFAWLHTYLRSGMPVVLALWRPEGGGHDGHAVAAAGFQTAALEPNPALQSVVPLRSARITKLYVHDDRIGPYARSFPRVSPRVSDGGGQGSEYVTLDIADEQWLLESAIVPLYPKIRLKVSHLLDLADTAADLLLYIVGKSLEAGLEVEFQYIRAGEYLDTLRSDAHFDQASTFLETVALPRWCAVMRWYLNDRELVEFVYDTTDIVRGKRSHTDLLRAIVTRDAAWRENFTRLADTLKVCSL